MVLPRGVPFVDDDTLTGDVTGFRETFPERFDPVEPSTGRRTW